MEGEDLIMQSAKQVKIKKQWFLWLALLIILWFVFNSVAQQYQNGQQQALEGAEQGTELETVTALIKASAAGQQVLDEAIEVEKGTSAFDAMMQADPELQYREFEGMGVMVESINGVGVTPGDNKFWALYVNGEMAAVGISSITLEENTLIEWKLEEIKSYTG